MAPDYFTLDDFDMTGKTVILRVDINSPIDPMTKRFLDDTRLKMTIPTLKELRKAKVDDISEFSKGCMERYFQLVTEIKKDQSDVTND